MLQIRSTLSLLFFIFSLNLIAQVPDIERIDPPNWWTGMMDKEIQVMVYGEDIASVDEVSLKYKGVKLHSIQRVENPNYLFLNIGIEKRAAAGNLSITFEKNGESSVIGLPLLERKMDPAQHNGFDASDVLYLLMPDRFANGDESNDEIPGMEEKINREDIYGRHGGDLKGVIDQMDYIEDLGITTLWLNPVQENNMPKESYHGYAITDFYMVDSRLGSNEDYVKLVDESHKRGLKVIMDMVVNHAGTNNYFIKDLPMHDWIHQFDSFTRSNYRGVMNNDPYVAESDLTLMNTGWFDHTMADLNQKNPYLSKYLIQQTLWWIEYAGLDGIRMDTWSYPDKYFLKDWADAVYRNYPDFKIVGEVWENKAATQSYWLADFNSGIDCLTDFVMHEALNKAFIEESSWHTGLWRIYYTLTEDRLYPNPGSMVTFLDNHDVPRFYSSVKEDLRKQKMGLTTLMTLRGIPQVYYGTELALSGHSHGEVRPEYHGGWDDHKKSAFTGDGLEDFEKELLAFTQKLLNWRKDQPVIHYGDLMHYVPVEDVYVYFRYDQSNSVMVILNANEESVELNTHRFRERMDGFSYGWDVMNDNKISDLSKIQIPAVSPIIIELRR